jgi:hypothetical protein
MFAQMRARTAIASTTYPIVLVALSRLGLSHGPGVALMLILFLALPVVIGLIGGWWALPIFAVAFAADVVIYQLLFWDDNPMLDGTDDLPPAVTVAGLVFLLPLVWLGAGWRRLKLTGTDSEPR